MEKAKFQEKIQQFLEKEMKKDFPDFPLKIIQCGNAYVLQITVEEEPKYFQVDLDVCWEKYLNGEQPISMLRDLQQQLTENIQSAIAAKIDEKQMKSNASETISQKETNQENNLSAGDEKRPIQDSSKEDAPQDKTEWKQNVRRQKAEIQEEMRQFLEGELKKDFLEFPLEIVKCGNAYILQIAMEKEPKYFQVDLNTCWEKYLNGEQPDSILHDLHQNVKESIQSVIKVKFGQKQTGTAAFESVTQKGTKQANDPPEVDRKGTGQESSKEDMLQEGIEWNQDAWGHIEETLKKNGLKEEWDLIEQMIQHMEHTKNQIRVAFDEIVAYEKKLNGTGIPAFTEAKESLQQASEEIGKECGTVNEMAEKSAGLKEALAIRLKVPEIMERISQTMLWVSGKMETAAEMAGIQAEKTERLSYWLKNLKTVVKEEKLPAFEDTAQPATVFRMAESTFRSMAEKFQKLADKSEKLQMSFLQKSPGKKQKEKQKIVGLL